MARSKSIDCQRVRAAASKRWVEPVRSQLTVTDRMTPPRNTDNDDLIALAWVQDECGVHGARQSDAPIHQRI